MDFVPTLPVILAFSAASLVLSITPGPDMTLFLGRTLASGPRAGLASLLGASTGCLVHTCAAVLGISALLAASPLGFWVLKIVGALYLMWLAFQAIRYGSTFTMEKNKSPSASLMRDYVKGIGINMLNPKVVIFFITFLPQFVSASDPYAWQKMLFLGVFFVVLTVPPMVVMIFMADRFSASLQRNPKATRIIDYVFGTIFAAFAIRILMVQTR